MARLTDSQMLLLSNFIYIKGVADNDELKTVESVINHFYKNGKLTDYFTEGQKCYKYKDGKWDYSKFNYPSQMTLDEWTTVLKHISEDPQLMKLEIKNGIDEKYGNTGSPMYYGAEFVENFKDEQEGLCAAFFVDPTSKTDGLCDATFVIRGTNGQVSTFTRRQKTSAVA